MNILKLFYRFKEATVKKKGSQGKVSQRRRVYEIWRFNLLCNNLKLPLQKTEGASEHVPNSECVWERKGETGKQTGKARPDGLPYIANCEARHPIMHTEQVSFINYPTGCSHSPLYAHKDTFLHPFSFFLVVVLLTASLHGQISAIFCVHS